MIKANGLFTNIEVKAKKVLSFSFHFLVLFNFFLFGGGGDYFLRRGKGEKDKDTG